MDIFCENVSSGKLSATKVLQRLQDHEGIDNLANFVRNGSVRNNLKVIVQFHINQNKIKYANYRKELYKKVFKVK